MQMNIFAFMILLAYPVLVLGLYQIFPSRRACLIAFLGAVMFLPDGPEGALQIHGVIVLNKITLASYSVLLATTIFDINRILRFRPRIWDIPMFLWTLAPMFSSLSNHLGAYDGIATIVNLWAGAWGVPYFLARIYFDDLEAGRELAFALVIGGLIYVPLCLWEIRMSPQLHKQIYGYYPAAFIQARRETFFRPTVFMQHGLAVSMFLTTSAVAALGLWLAGVRDKIFGLNMLRAAIVLCIVTVACQSMTATVCLLGGVAAIALTRAMRSPIPLIALMLVPSVYMISRATGIFTGEALVHQVQKIDPDRADSLNTRLINENKFVAKAMQQPVFGFGSTDWFPRDPVTGRFIGIPDGLWIIVLGKHGLFGLVCLTLTGMVPILVLLRLRHTWRLANLPAPVLLCWVPVIGQIWLVAWLWSRIRKPDPWPLMWIAALAVAMALHMCDNMLNAMADPLFALAAGSVVTLCTRRQLNLNTTETDATRLPSATTSTKRLWRPDGSSVIFTPPAGA